MFKEKLRELFTVYPPEIQTLIMRVLAFEQENISYERVPRVKEQIDEIVTQVAVSREAARGAKTDR